MRYSQGFKESIIKKMLPPENRKVTEMSRETGVAAWTLYQWKRAVREGKLDPSDGELRPGDRNPGEKLRLLLQGNSLSDEEKGSWLREQGLHSEHLHAWEQELRDIVTDKDQKIRRELTETKKKNDRNCDFGLLAIFCLKPGFPRNPALFAAKPTAPAGIPGSAGLD